MRSGFIQSPLPAQYVRHRLRRDTPWLCSVGFAPFTKVFVGDSHHIPSALLAWESVGWECSVSHHAVGSRPADAELALHVGGSKEAVFNSAVLFAFLRKFLNWFQCVLLSGSIIRGRYDWYVEQPAPCFKRAGLVHRNHGR